MMGSNTSEKTLTYNDENKNNFDSCHLVRVPVSSVDTAVLVIKLYRAGDGLGKSEAAGCCNGPAEFVPERFGHILGYQRVSGLDLRKWIRHFSDYFLAGDVANTSSDCCVEREER